jgi:hypothetical protein
LYYFHKKLQIKKTKKPIFSVFLDVFLGFFGWVFLLPTLITGAAAAAAAEIPEAHLQFGGGLRDDGRHQQDGRRDRAAPPATPAPEDCSAAAAAADAAQDNG